MAAFFTFCPTDHEWTIFNMTIVDILLNEISYRLVDIIESWSLITEINVYET